MRLLLLILGLIILIPPIAVGEEELPPPPPPVNFDLKQHQDTYKNDCALTFDDGPGVHTNQLLDLLAARGIKATFFVLGNHAHRYPDIIRRMVAEGHDVEDHSWDHPDMRKLGEPERRKEIDDTLALLKSLGATPRFFRPPYGSYDTALVKQAKDNGLEVVLWTQDSFDWRYHTAAHIEGDIMPRGKDAKHREPHGIYLFHDTHNSTITAMPLILDDLKGKGCNFTTIDQWVADQPGTHAVIAPPPDALAPEPEKH